MKALLCISILLALSSPALGQTESEKKKPAPRTLDEINIEGEVDMPQVLFITARERFRTDDKLHRRYLKSCAQIGREAEIPRRISNEDDKSSEES